MTTELISPEEIQSQLDQIWESLESSNKTRASLFNLIFYTKNSSKKKMRQDYIKTICQKVIEKFPARILFISKDMDAKAPHLSTSVAVLPCRQTQSESACDFIHFDFSGHFEERLPFIILPQLIPDLPIYVVYAEDPQEGSALFAQLQRLSSRIIFDSDTTQNLPKFAQCLLDLERHCSFAVADLNWGRMESWRNLFTSTFYSPERLFLLKKAKSLEITYNAKKSEVYCHTSIQGIYFQGWLAAQLGWSLKESKIERETLLFVYKKGEGEVSISLKSSQEEEAKAGSITAVSLATENEQFFNFKRDKDNPYLISLHFSSLEKCDTPLKYIFAKDESGASLVKEICHKGTSQHFLNLLRSLKEIKGSLFGE